MSFGNENNHRKFLKRKHMALCSVERNRYPSSQKTEFTEFLDGLSSIDDCSMVFARMNDNHMLSNIPLIFAVAFDDMFFSKWRCTRPMHQNNVDVMCWFNSNMRFKNSITLIKFLNNVPQDQGCN
jgi:hypothetical protein